MNEPPLPESSPYWPSSGSFDAPADAPTDEPSVESPDEPANAPATEPPDGPAVVSRGEPTGAPRPRHPAHTLTIVAGIIAVIGLIATVGAVVLNNPQQSIGTASTAAPVVPGEASASPSDLPDGSDASSTDVYVAHPGTSGFSPDNPHPFGTGEMLQSVTTHEDALRLVVSAPIDITAVAREVGIDDPEGAYIAVPVTSTEIDPAAISDGAGGTLYPYDYWRTPDGQMIETADIAVPGYPQLADAVQSEDDGTWSYFEIFDVPTSGIGAGLYQVVLNDPDTGTQYVFWGPLGK